MSTIYGTSANDSIYNSISGSVIFADSGDDTITNTASNVSINGGEGNDKIYVAYANAEKNTVQGGAGDDSITLHSYGTGKHLIKYAKGDGNDAVYNYRDDDTILISGAQYKTSAINSEVIISIINSGNITLFGAVGKTLNILGEPVSQNTDSSISYQGTSGADYFENSGNFVTINGAAGNDTLINYGGNPSILTQSYGQNVSIDGGTGDDLITNSGANATIYGGAGHDSITNLSYGENSTIYGDAGNDFIQNNAKAEIYGGAGNDSISNTKLGENASIYGEGGNDSIVTSSAKNVYIDGGYGDDYIYAAGNVKGVTLAGGTGNDSLLGHTGNTYGITFFYNYGDGKDTIYYYHSTDTIKFGDDVTYKKEISGSNVIITTDDKGSITIYNAADKTINISGGTEGPYNVNINNKTKNTLVNGSAEDDYISNLAMNVTIDAKEGNDTISNSAQKVSIETGNGNDIISLSGNYGEITVKGGKDADEIYNISASHSGRIYQYIIGDGNDTIFNANSNDTLQFLSGYFTMQQKDGDFLVYPHVASVSSVEFNETYEHITFKNLHYVNVVSPNKIYIAPNPTTLNDTIRNDFDNETIDALAGNDFIYNSGNSVTINGNTGKDTIAGYGEYLSVNGGAGNDSLNLNEVLYSKIYGGEGNDTIKGRYIFSTIDGGAGDDSISNTGYSVTITGGKGNDTIHSKGKTDGSQYNYSNGDGKDIIYGFNKNDTLNLTSGTISKSSINGDDVILTIGTGNITLVGMKDDSFYLKQGSQGAKSTIFGGSKTPQGISITGDTLTASTAFLGGEISLSDYPSVKTANASALFQNISITGNENSNSIIGGRGDDTLNGGKGTNSLAGGKGEDIFIYSGTKTYITDYSAADDSIKISGNYTIQGSSLSGNDVSLNFKKGESIIVKNGKNKEITIIDSKEKETSQIYGRYTYNSSWTGITLNSDFYGSYLDSGEYDTKVKIINAVQVDDESEIYGNDNANTITGSNQNNSTIHGGAGNDYISGGSYKDNILGDAGNDTIYGGAGNNTLTGGAGKDVFIYGGGNDLITDFNIAEDKISLKSGTISAATLRSSDLVLKIGSGSLTVKNGKNKEITIGKNIYYNNFIYDLKKTSATLGADFSGSLNSSDYSSSVKNIDASNATENLTISGNKQSNTIYGGAGNDSILGNAGNDSLNGGKGNDTLYGGAGNDTLTGGDGADIFVYSGGSDVITDFVNLTDRISLASGAVNSVTLKNSDMVFKIGKGTLTFKNAKDKDITIGDKTYNNNLTYNLNKTSLIFGATFKGTLNASDYSALVEEIDASATTKGVVIFGNAKDNTITGGNGADKIDGGSGADEIFGGKGNDSLNGGAGNDTLYGGAGNDTFNGGDGIDTFVYSAGKDVIKDYTAGQDKIIVEGEIGKVTYKNGDVIFKIGNGTLTVKDGEGKNISVIDSSGKTQTYSQTFDLFEDNNFISEDVQLSSITEQNFCVTQIQNSDYFSLAQDSTLLTFAKENLYFK